MSKMLERSYDSTYRSHSDSDSDSHPHSHSHSHSHPHSHPHSHSHSHSHPHPHPHSHSPLPPPPPPPSPFLHDLPIPIPRSPSHYPEAPKYQSTPLDEGEDNPDNEEIWTLFDQMKKGICLDGLLNVKENEIMSSESQNNGNEGNDGNDGEETLYCHECKSSDIELEKGNYVCQKCCVIVSRQLDVSAEWRSFPSEDHKGADMTRCGMATNALLPDSSLGSMIGFSNDRESHCIRMMRRFHLWNSMSYKERTLYNIFDTLTLNATSHGINKNIIDEAKNLYKKFSDIKIGRGDNRSAVIASSVYMACKTNKVPRSAKEIAKIFNLKPTVMTKGCKKFEEIMHMNTTSTSAMDFISRFCCRLNLSLDFQDVCKTVINIVEGLDIACDNTPPSLAVSIICFCSNALGMKLDKKEVAKECDISQITINKCCHKLELYKNEIFDDEMMRALHT